MHLTSYGVMYQQRSVIYKHDDPYPDVGYKIFKYVWVNFETGGSGVSEIACRGQNGLDTLVEHWNRLGRGTWKYYSLQGGR